MRLKDKNALVTGGSTGIGFATAKLFVAEGARVIITGQDERRLADAVKALGQQAYGVVGDIGKQADIEKLAAVVRERFDRLDVAFLNAGIAPRSTLAEITEEEFDLLFAINVKGVLFPIQKLESLFADGASIIVTTSINNMIGMERTHLYSATKAAGRSLVRTLANELSARGIRVNAVSPGPIATPMIDKLAMSDEEITQMVASIMPRIPLKRGGSPDELAHVVLFLASSESSYVTGGEIRVDGGWIDVNC